MSRTDKMQVQVQRWFDLKLVSGGHITFTSVIIIEEKNPS
jgi:hypothetical protein